MKRDLLICSTMRENSSRCRAKMVRPFYDTTMADIMMSKLEKLNKNYSTILAIYPGDKRLSAKIKDYDIEIVERNKHSVTDANRCNETCSFLKDFEYSHVLWLNASAPFITIKTIKNVIKKFKEDKSVESIHVVKEINNWIWNIDFNPINLSNLSFTRTQECNKTYASIHVLHLYNREYMLQTGRYWTLEPNNPFFYVVKDDFEFLDVDTEFDFRLCELIYQERNW